jgi:hypothetical protein
MIPLPWSHTALQDFISCPKAYYEKRVAKSIPWTQGEEAKWGERVHKAFEDRLCIRGYELPSELQIHEDYLQGLLNKNGVLFAEQNIALNKRAQPCSYHDKDVWYRGKIDVTIVDNDAACCSVVDFKTGKKREKWSQLAEYAIWAFAMYPKIKLCDVRFYWTVQGDESRKVWSREEVPALWDMIIPDLKQYLQAFKTDTWQARPSGLCKAHCLVPCIHNGDPILKAKGAKQDAAK